MQIIHEKKVVFHFQQSTACFNFIGMKFMLEQERRISVGVQPQQCFSSGVSVCMT